MRFQIEERSKLKVVAPKFLCDSIIHPQIESPLPATPFFMAIIGSAGSGKTSLAINLLTNNQAYRKAFHNVHVVMPSHSVASLKNNVFKNHDKMHDELDYETLENILETVKDDAEEKQNSLLLLDDVTASLKDLELQKLLRRIIYNRRHYRLSIVVLVQSYSAMPLTIRKTLSHFALFRPRNKKEYRSIFEELIFLDKETADKLIDFVFDEPFGFLFCNVDTNRICKKFDTLSINGA